MKTLPLLLAIDSSTGCCSAAVWKNNSVVAYCEESVSSLQSKRLLLMVEEVLNQSRTEYSDLSAVACTVGPGSFTGIRIGLASARGVGFTANIPVLGFSSLEVLAFAELQKKEEKTISVVMNAGKGEIIFQHFSPELEALCQPTLEKAKGNDIITSPRADILAMLAVSFPNKAVAPLPFYVRLPDAKLPSSSNVS